MATDVIMPKVDMVMDEGTIVHWYKAEGEPVQAGEPLFEIETDKATMVIEAPASGILTQISAPVDATVPVASVIARIVEPHELGSRPSAAEAPPPGSAPSVTTSADAAAPSGAAPLPASEDAPTLPPALSAQIGGSPSAPPRPRATPIARKLAREHAIDLATVPGSGPRGRIGKRDVLRALATMRPSGTTSDDGKQAQYATPGAESTAASPVQHAAASDAIGGRWLPLTGVRRIIAQRMALSAGVPQFTVSINVNMLAATQLRERLAYRPSFTAIIARVVAALLPRHPMLNASFRDDGIWLYEAVHLGIALDSGGDLLVPVIRDANRRTLRELHNALTELRQKAEAKQLTPADLQGSTFSISNLGMFGIDHFTALLNPPEAAILAIGSITPRPYPSPSGDAWTWQPGLTLTLSVDHRVADGATAARFLQDIRAALEEPYLLL
ncbi:dihydrolipoamide acetyltransferase family protein [Kallotenue papyrolyticum]|uniref:dihydrolipoamide acetyltransferase family protein n=1 Tax=Kallotenue papyrolyticum TaxID=1325125 RepID=UPI000492C429|nr:dihydrolipoamide acetyltransferase family protein [Kallotenue papyrolyticum]